MCENTEIALGVTITGCIFVFSIDYWLSSFPEMFYVKCWVTLNRKTYIFCSFYISDHVLQLDGLSNRGMFKRCKTDILLDSHLCKIHTHEGQTYNLSHIPICLLYINIYMQYSNVPVLSQQLVILSFSLNKCICWVCTALNETPLNIEGY